MSKSSTSDMVVSLAITLLSILALVGFVYLTVWVFQKPVNGLVCIKANPTLLLMARIFVVLYCISILFGALNGALKAMKKA